MPYGIDDTDRWTRYAPKLEPTKSAPREVIEGVGYYEPIEVHTSLPILPEPTARDRAQMPSARKNRCNYVPQLGEVYTWTTPPPPSTASTCSSAARSEPKMDRAGVPSLRQAPKGTHVPRAAVTGRENPDLGLTVRRKCSPRMWPENKKQPKPQPPEPQPERQSPRQSPRRTEPFQTTLRERELLVGGDTQASFGHYGATCARNILPPPQLVRSLTVNCLLTTARLAQCSAAQRAAGRQRSSSGAWPAAPSPG